MKKQGILVVFVLFLAFLVACQADHNKVSKITNDTVQLSYSNLLDQPSQEQLKKSIGKNLAQNDTDRFLEQVTFYNQHIPTKSLVQSGYGLSKKLVPAYDVGSISEKWTDQFPLFPGYNCRLTTFQLLKSSLSVSPTIKADDSLLFIDKEAITNAPNLYQLTTEEEERFKVIFGAVTTENVSDTKLHVAKVQGYWKQQGLNFHNERASMISVWFHDQLDNTATKLFIGHVGVLLPDGKDYLFVEKISFEEPYQVVRFQDKKSVYNYLMAKYDTDTSGSTHPFIMENDQEMKFNK